MQIFVTSPEGQSFTLNVKTSHTINNVKTAIKTMKGIQRTSNDLSLRRST